MPKRWAAYVGCVLALGKIMGKVYYRKSMPRDGQAHINVKVSVGILWNSDENLEVMDVELCAFYVIWCDAIRNDYGKRMRKEIDAYGQVVTSVKGSICILLNYHKKF